MKEATYQPNIRTEVMGLGARRSTKGETEDIKQNKKVQLSSLKSIAT